MIEVPVTSGLPIAEWDPALRLIVRCLAALDSIQKEYEQKHWSSDVSANRYGELVKNIENFLVAKGAHSSWNWGALAELVIHEDGQREFIPRKQGLEYLSTAAENGYLNAQIKLAQLADGGEIPPPEYSWQDSETDKIPRERWDTFNRKQSERWWRAAAESGSSYAQYAMCDRLIDSEDPQIFAQGIKWLRIAAYSQVPCASAQYELAYMMDLERAGPDSAEERWRLYESAALTEVPEAMLAAGHYREYGIGVARNDELAAEWYLKAAELGYDEGYLLAGLLTGNTGQLEKAAKAGHVEAMLLLAPDELDRGLSWDSFDSFQSGLNRYTDAASRGNLEAALALAEIYERGWRGHSHGDYWMQSGYSDVDRLENALSYYEQALKLGCDWAAMEIERIQKLLDNDLGVC